MHVETKFRDNVDAALARIVDPMQPFLLSDAKLLVDSVAPITNDFLCTPLINTLDLTRAAHPGNQPRTHKRLDVEHHRYGASGYYAGDVRIVSVDNDPDVKPIHRFHYTQTPERHLFALWTDLVTDEVIVRSPFGRRFDAVRYGVFVKQPDQHFDGVGAQQTFARLLGQPRLAKAVFRKPGGLQVA